MDAQLVCYNILIKKYRHHINSYLAIVQRLNGINLEEIGRVLKDYVNDRKSMESHIFIQMEAHSVTYEEAMKSPALIYMFANFLSRIDWWEKAVFLNSHKTNEEFLVLTL